ncbi:cytochrome P450 [Billgrantia lactosivorans]|uniref:cytochrome P450 n=1 Tax=Billgrantia lactosivorans TaxID=2185141 RepID=UPI000DAE81E7|nr:cytochrome P450 [Halomonas lactosivorans]
MTRDSVQGALPQASVAESLAVLTDVLIPNVAKGVLIRRPRIVGMAERLGLDRRAVQRLQQLNEKYGRGPLMLQVPGEKTMALVLDPDHVNRVLDQSPAPFATAEQAKRSALAHFEPDMALVSHGRERAERRRFNEAVLHSECPVHGLGERFVTVAREEVDELLHATRQQGDTLDWAAFFETWSRVVRRVVLGDTARDDHALTEALGKLRAAGNWGFMHPGRDRLRDALHERLRRYLKRAEPGSLAAEVARVPISETTQPGHQVTQWLFAFDPAGMATFRTLALLAAHPEAARRARREAASLERQTTPELPYLRACVLESLRLWPTTPMLLRQSTETTLWENGAMPADTSLLILAPYFHRDERHLASANRFDPDLWLKPEAAGAWPLIPFSGGSGICPGRRLVLLVTSTVLASCLSRREFRLDPPSRLLSSKPMPPLLDNYALRFRLDPH